MSKKQNYYTLDPQTQIEVIAIKKGKKPFKQVMTIQESNQLKPKPGWTYIRYQLGFSQFNN